MILPCEDFLNDNECALIYVSKVTPDLANNTYSFTFVVRINGCPEPQKFTFKYSSWGEADQNRQSIINSQMTKKEPQALY